MKICMIIPPAPGGFKVPERIYGCSYNIYPQPDLPLLYVASALEQKGHQIVYKDFISEEKRWKDLERFIEKNRFDAYVFHTVLLSQKIDLKTCRLIRQKDKDAPIVFFGPQPTYFPKQFLSDENSYIIRGEPEESIQELFEKLEKSRKAKKKQDLSKIPGLSHVKEGKPVHNKSFGIIKDINSIPFPARHLIDHIKHKFYNPKLGKRPMTVMLTSRGCPYRCYFCLTPDNKVMINNKQMTIGEFVESHKDGSWQNIKKIKKYSTFTHKSNKKPIKEITRRKHKGNTITITPHYLNESVTLTENHEVFVLSGDRTIKKVAGNLTKDDILIIPKPRTTKDIPYIDTKKYLHRKESNRPIGRILPEAKCAEIRKLHSQDLSNSEIARKANVKRDTVTKYLRSERKKSQELWLKEERGNVKYSFGKTKIPSRIRIDNAFMKLAGYYLAEGSVNLNHNRPNSATVTFTFSKTEKKYAGEVRKLVKEVFGLDSSITTHESTTRVTVASSILAELFKNMFGKYAGNKALPPEFLELKGTLLEGIIYGLFRGDASVEKTHHIEYATTSKELAFQIKYVLLKLGILPKYRITGQKPHRLQGRLIRRNHPVHRIRAGGFDAERISRITGMKMPSLKGRTKTRYMYCKRFDDFFAVKIKEIKKKKYEGYVYNMHVAQDNSYTSSFIAVSNCVPNSLSWARELEWKKDHGGHKPPVGIRSAQNIIDEFKQIKKQGYRSVSIIDDMFLLGGKQRILDICKGIAPLKMEFGILARADHALDIEVLRALKKAGCQYVDLGVESFNKNILKYVRKDLDPKVIPKSIRNIRKAGMEPKINIMFGTCPLDSKEEIKKTIKKACDLPVDYCMFSITTPFPGTDFEKIALEKGWILKKRYNKMLRELDPSKSALISYPHLSAKDLEKLTRKANRKFYLRPKKVLKQLGRIRSFKDLLDTIKGGFQLIKGKN